MSKTEVKTKTAAKKVAPKAKAKSEVKAVKAAPKKAKVVKTEAKSATPTKAAKVEGSTTQVKAAKKNADRFAVLQIGGTQLLVHEGGKYEVEKLAGVKGDKLEVAEVLMVSDSGKVQIGEPFVKGAKISLTIDSQKRAKKIEAFTYKAKSRYRKSWGHKQQITRVAVDSIQL